MCKQSNTIRSDSKGSYFITDERFWYKSHEKQINHKLTLKEKIDTNDVVIRLKKCDNFVFQTAKNIKNVAFFYEKNKNDFFITNIIANLLVSDSLQMVIFDEIGKIHTELSKYKIIDVSKNNLFNWNPLEKIYLNLMSIIQLENNKRTSIRINHLENETNKMIECISNTLFSKSYAKTIELLIKTMCWILKKYPKTFDLKRFNFNSVLEIAKNYEKISEIIKKYININHILQEIIIANENNEEIKEKASLFLNKTEIILLDKKISHELLQKIEIYRNTIKSNVSIENEFDYENIKFIIFKKIKPNKNEEEYLLRLLFAKLMLNFSAKETHSREYEDKCKLKVFIDNKFISTSDILDIVNNSTEYSRFITSVNCNNLNANELDLLENFELKIFSEMDEKIKEKLSQRLGNTVENDVTRKGIKKNKVELLSSDEMNEISKSSNMIVWSNDFKAILNDEFKYDVLIKDELTSKISNKNSKKKKMKEEKTIDVKQFITNSENEIKKINDWFDGQIITD